ncbi:hypothetical protein BCR32DRAFT_328151 [Anaeromyces robustus]|uniref:BRCT domain-containing protein n=1 Tax=Anaeromyces robustus TaxID=1754192 RepID=A0A1Y1X0S4_9FUNG|nr:hypothetical protein BCR32DRAFT_328151 [Anaeromyces robustus]|eukprot:ORX79411.1 hypothetical protein BCR32DRAFT_328151 [Anaeromyces robustus]
MTTTEFEDDPQSSFRNSNEPSSSMMTPYLKNQPVILSDEWIIQCLINQRIVNYNNYQFNQ